MLKPTKEDLSYLAGFFDGEGSIYIITNYKRNQHSLVVSITNTDMKILNWIKDFFGGNIAKTLFIKEKNNKPCGRIRFYSQNALFFLKQIEPFLKIKKEKARLAIRFQSQLKVGIRTLTNEEQLIYKQRIANA